MKKLFIRKVKLALITRCNLSCPYCFVERQEGVMPLAVARDAVMLLLDSSGREKLLSLYGGEPLLCFDRVRQIVRFARQQAGRAHKELTINLCTNLTLLEPPMARFFAREGVKVVVSLAGNRQDHDRIRSAARGKGSYDQVAARLPLLFEHLPRLDVGAAFCVHPLTVERMEANWGHLLELGFRHINIEIIRDQHAWTSHRQEQFEKAMGRVARDMMARAVGPDPVYLNPVNWEVRHGLLTRPLMSRCLFEYYLEVYPGGRVAFSPFLLNSPDSSRYLVASQPRMVERPAHCSGRASVLACAVCRKRYFSSTSEFAGADEVRAIYLRHAAAMARSLKGSSLTGIKRYLRSIRQDVCF